MMLLRNRHMEAFSEASRLEFEADMREHLRVWFPERTEGMSDDALTTFIRDVITRAREYHITARRDLCKYLGVCIVYGPDCDTQADYPWIGETLRGGGTPSDRVNVVTELAIKRASKK